MTTNNNYASFFSRFLASVLDSILIFCIIFPVMISIYGFQYLRDFGEIQGGFDFFFNWLLPAILVISMWHFKQATPGKMILGLKIVDRTTGLKPSFKQLIIRYMGYFLSTITLGLGFLWMFFDANNQCWHDKLAETVIIKKSKSK